MRTGRQSGGMLLGAIMLLLAVVGGGTAAAQSARREAVRVAAVAGLARIDSLLAAAAPGAAVEEARRLMASYGDDPGWGWQFEGRLGLALLVAGHPAEALPHLEEVTRRQPLAAAHHRNLGAALVQLNRRGRALSEYQVAVELAPGDPELRREYGQMLLSFRDLRGAARELAVARELCGDCPEIDEPLASLHLLQRDYRAAVPYLEKLYRRRETPASRRVLIAALAEAGQDSALAAFVGSLAPTDRTSDEWRLLVEAEGRLGIWDLSREMAARLRTNGPAAVPPLVAADDAFWGRIALNLIAAGDHELALAAVDRAITLAPGSVVHRNNRVVALTALERHAEARAEWARVLDLDPNRASEAEDHPQEAE